MEEVAEEVEEVVGMEATEVGMEVTEVGMEATEEDTVVTAVGMEATEAGMEAIVVDMEIMEVTVATETMVDMEIMEATVTEMITTKNADVMRVLAAAVAMTMNGTHCPVAEDAESAEKVAKHTVFHNEKKLCLSKLLLQHLNLPKASILNLVFI
jgi:hypothetical protein